ncbi:MAG TPA: glycosyltransferase family A protein [Elusimicrobiota bacterium]|nr:glycosyltransferase family A protein [Elusimicrobiota bacterium]
MPRGRPFVTCVIPAYNRARFLPRAIESALGQDFPESEREIIVVDDGSTDGTARLLARYGEKIRVIRQEESGQGESIRRGILAARGKIIANLDADDAWKPRKLRRISDFFSRFPDVGEVIHRAEHVDEEMNVLRGFYREDALHKIRMLPRRASAAAFARHDIGSLKRLAAGCPPQPPARSLLLMLLLCGGSSWAVRKSAVAGRLAAAPVPKLSADFFYACLAMFPRRAAIICLNERLSFWRHWPHDVGFGGKGSYEIRKTKALLESLDCLLALFPESAPLSDSLREIRKHYTARVMLLNHGRNS